MIASFIGVTDERVRQLAEDRVLPRVGRGRFPLRATILAFTAWRADEQRRASKSAGQSRVSDARAREIELRLSEREGRLIPDADVTAALDAIVGPLISDLSAVPARVTDDVAQRDRIEVEMDGVLNALSKRFEQAGADLRAGRDALASAAEDDADGVGEPE